MVNVRRGQMWYYAPKHEVSGSVQSGSRPVIIVSNNVINLTSNVLLAIPCTRQVKRNFPTHVMFVSEGGVAVAITEQVMCISKDDLTTCLGYIDEYIMEQVDAAMQVSLGLVETSYTRDIKRLGET